jgi:glutamine cyclotransferase
MPLEKPVSSPRVRRNVSRRKNRQHQPADAAPALETADAGSRRRRFTALAVLLCSLILAGAAWAFLRNGRTPEISGYEIVNTYPHDTGAFCQGLVVADGTLYESTGQYGQSSIRIVDLERGAVIEQRRLRENLFGEGITVWDGELIQLTWKSQTAYIYDAKSLDYRRSFRYAGQGWGLTHDSKHLIVSDGSSTLRFLDPKTFQVLKRLKVTVQGKPIGKLNELEYVDGEILANLWYSDYVARISPDDGRVTGWIDLRGLLAAYERPYKENVLNGIAYDKEQDRLFVTGKNWPKLFEIRVVKKK